MKKINLNKKAAVIPKYGICADGADDDRANNRGGF